LYLFFNYNYVHQHKAAGVRN